MYEKFALLGLVTLVVLVNADNGEFFIEILVPRAESVSPIPRQNKRLYIYRVQILIGENR